MGMKNIHIFTFISTLNLPNVICFDYYLFSDGSSIDLDFHDMSLLLSATKDLLLGMGDQSDNRAVFLNLAQILFDFLFAQIISPFQLSLRECLLLRFRPIFSIFDKSNDGGERESVTHNSSLFHQCLPTYRIVNVISPLLHPV